MGKILFYIALFFATIGAFFIKSKENEHNRDH